MTIFHEKLKNFTPTSNAYISRNKEDRNFLIAIFEFFGYLFTFGFAFYFREILTSWPLKTASKISAISLILLWTLNIQLTCRCHLLLSRFSNTVADFRYIIYEKLTKYLGRFLSIWRLHIFNSLDGMRGNMGVASIFHSFFQSFFKNYGT